MEWYIGCSGFYYKEWKEIFYPAKLPQRKWFEYYCSQFNALEINSTFYRFPRVTLLKGWEERSPDDFKFAIKAPRLITHFKQFNDCGSLLQDFYATAREGLGDKLGPVLFQLNPRIAYSQEKLEQITECLDHSFLNVFEFRESNWWNGNVYQHLGLRKAPFSGISYPKLPDEVIANTDIVYYRFHGIPVLYKSLYDEARVKGVAEDIMENRSVRQAWVFFNNTWGPSALVNARQLQAIVGTVQR